MNLANRLTLCRILATPVFLAICYAPIAHRYTLAAIVFIAAGITDILDGYIARKTASVTSFGKIFDPVADKILALAAFLVLVHMDELAAWGAFAFVARDIFISGVRICLSASGGKILSASWLGKAKTVTQDVAIALLLLQFDLVFIQTLYLQHIAVALAIGFTLWSAADYILANRAVLQGQV